DRPGGGVRHRRAGGGGVRARRAAARGRAAAPLQAPVDGSHRGSDRSTVLAGADQLLRVAGAEAAALRWLGALAALATWTLLCAVGVSRATDDKSGTLAGPPSPPAPAL